jgi:hypothetical protein
VHSSPPRQAKHFLACRTGRASFRAVLRYRAARSSL